MKTKNAKKNSKKNTTPKSTTPAPAKAATKAPKGKPGRPLYVPKFPRKVEFTLKDFCLANGVDPETGKGPNCSKLTLIKWLGRDKARKGRSLVKRLDHTAAPDSEKGLGRKAFLFSLREKLAADSADTATPAPASPEIPTPAEASSDTSDYEAQKAALLGTPTPVVDITTPADDTTPEMTPAEPVPSV
jgi:hypothetical protein